MSANASAAQKTGRSRQRGVPRPGVYAGGGGGGGGGSRGPKLPQFCFIWRNSHVGRRRRRRRCRKQRGAATEARCVGRVLNITTHGTSVVVALRAEKSHHRRRCRRRRGSSVCAGTDGRAVRRVVVVVVVVVLLLLLVSSTLPNAGDRRHGLPCVTELVPPPPPPPPPPNLLELALHVL